MPPTPPTRKRSRRDSVSAAASRRISPRAHGGFGQGAAPAVLGGRTQPTTPTPSGTGAVRQPSGSQLNKGTPEAAAVGWGSERVGHRFTVGFTPDGRVVHLYGSGVPADQRRVVLSKGQSAAARRRMSYTP